MTYKPTKCLFCGEPLALDQKDRWTMFLTPRWNADVEWEFAAHESCLPTELRAAMELDPEPTWPTPPD